MNKKLESKLFKKYPKIFRQKDLPMNQTCMCWGISTGDGWYNIINILCNLLQFDIDHNDYKQVEFTQVKEKFGTLRIHTSGADKTQQAYIRFTEHLSGLICESCGSMTDIIRTTGWISTICKKCLFKHEIKQYLNNIKFRILCKIGIYKGKLIKCLQK